MKKLSRRDLEAIAERVVRAYSKMPENVGRPLLRVDPELLVQGLLSLKIDYRKLSEDGSILGMTSFGKVSILTYDDDNDVYSLDWQTILVDKGLNDNNMMSGRRNFTIMHEGSHHILGMLFPQEYGMPKKIRCCTTTTLEEHRITDWVEWQTNTLTSYMLMPSECIYKAMKNFNLEGGIERLNRVIDSQVYERFSNMAEFLGASKKALDIRLNQLGLIKEDNFEDPYEPIDIRK